MKTKITSKNRIKLFWQRFFVIAFVMTLFGLVAYRFFEICPVCVISNLTNANGHFHQVQGIIVEIGEDSIVIAPSGIDKLHFLGKRVVLSLSEVATSGIPAGLISEEEIIATYNQKRIKKEKDAVCMEVVFWISRLE